MEKSQDREIGGNVVARDSDPFLVTFDEPFDPENPKDWPAVRKWMVTGVLSASTFNRIMISTIMAPALTVIGQELHMSNIESVMAMSVYLLAGAFGPLFIGPLSELYGRSVILHSTNIWFLVWNILCGFAHNKATLIASRLLAGLGASAVYALVGGVLGDVWRPEERGRGLSLYYLFPLLGAALGPILGGFIIDNTTWRWIFWSTSIFQGAIVLVSFLLFRETCADTLLARRAAKLRERHGSSQYRTTTERIESGRSAAWLLSQSLTRPIRLLLFHPIVQVQALLSGFNYGLLYLVLSSYSDLWVRQYHESVSRSGLHYISLCLGEIAGAEIGGPLLDIVFAKLKARANGIATPEFRVPMMLPGVILAPVGMFMYGWAAQAHSQWIIVDVGVFILSFGMQISGPALQAYVMDTYPDHASSATAASQFVRSLTAFGFPLFTPMLYSALGYGWGSSTMAIIAIAIGGPVPLLLWKYGPKLRQKMLSSY